MFENLSQSSGNILGYKVTGKITKEDYVTLTADVDALLQQESSINILLDLEACKGEQVKAWGADLRFGREYGSNIDKMAVIGDRKWQELLPTFAEKFDFAHESQSFSTDERDAAWEWVRT